MAIQIARLKGSRHGDRHLPAMLSGAPGSPSSGPTSPSIPWIPTGWSRRAKPTGGKGVDLTIDQVSGGLANQTMQAAAVLGRVVNVGRLGGFTAEFDFDLHALKRIDYIGVTFRHTLGRRGARDQRCPCAPISGMRWRTAH